MRSRHELDYGSQYHQNNHHTAQGDMSRVLTPYHMNGENGSAAIDFNAYGIREGGLRAEGDCEYGQPQQGGRDRQQHSREHERDEGTEIILSPNRDNRLETRNGNGRLDFGRSHPMHHTSRRDDSINYDAEDSEANEPSIDGQSFSGSRSRRTTGVRGTWGQHLETHSLYGYGVITSEFGSAEWFRAMEDLFRRSRGREGIPEGQPGVILEETDGTEITRIPNPNLGNGGSAKEARGGHDGTWERCAKIDIG